jgi:hypothetical protein
LATYRDAKLFKLHLNLLGELPRTLDYTDGLAAERDAARMLAESRAAHPEKCMGSPAAFIEWVIPNGSERGRRSTYARLNGSEWHTVALYDDPESPTRQRYTCSCGAKRYTIDEMHTHQRNVGRCISCWGQEELRPIVDGAPNTRAWADCPSCEYGNARDGAPAFDERLYAHPSTLLTARPVSEDYTF